MPTTTNGTFKDWLEAYAKAKADGKTGEELHRAALPVAFTIAMRRDRYEDALKKHEDALLQFKGLQVELFYEDVIQGKLPSLSDSLEIIDNIAQTPVLEESVHWFSNYLLLNPWTTCIEGIHSPR